MKRVIVSVINDLSTDQRVHKHCTTLMGMGYDVLLIGRQQSTSIPLEKRPYQMHRMQLPFEKGPMFYACFNITLLFHLLFRKVDVLFSNDLDTLLPNFLASRLKNTSLIYDSHEYFTEVPELVRRPKVQNVWRKLENILIPKLQVASTVNQSIAELYRDKYGIEMKVLRNVSMSNQLNGVVRTRSELTLPEDKKLIILQGSGINMDRGAEEAVEAMQFVKNGVLLIIGSGDVVSRLHKMVEKFGLKNKVIFRGGMPYKEMMAYTRISDLGLTLDKDTNINYRYSLPNKLFDYIQAGIPVLASDLVEVKRIVDAYDVGEITYSHNPKKLAQKINEMLDSPKNEKWRANTLKAQMDLNWENESKVLMQMLKNIDG